EQAASVMANDRQVMEGNRIFTVQEDLTTAEGEITFLATKGPLHDAAGNVIGMVGVSHDITERKRAEEEIRESEHKYRVLFETANDGIFLLNETGVVDCNQKGADMCGRTREEMIGCSPMDFSPERQPDGQLSSELAAAKMAAALDGEPLRFEWESLRADGEPFAAELALNRVEMGGAVFLQAICRDITERKRAEEAVARERTFSEDIINSLPGIFYMYDDKGKLVRWNKKHEEATGYSSEEMLGRYVLDWFSEEHKQYILSQVQSVFAEGESFAEAPLSIKNGSQVPYFFTGRLATLDGKQYLVGVGIDITERKRSEAERTLLA
ncbi:MAG TPA: hypothetical protein DCZ69_06550, partial [Syntrophobacteraceae bacterium]|nr:hypothetical protein [Syntrophobacteraceae bacterium]